MKQYLNKDEARRTKNNNQTKQFHRKENIYGRENQEYVGRCLFQYKKEYFGKNSRIVNKKFRKE